MVLVVLFTTVATRPNVPQQYEIYTFGGLNLGKEDGSGFTNALKKEFSYDILEVSMDNFQDGTLGTTAFTVRRSVLQGSAAFVSNNKEDPEEASSFEKLAAMGLVSSGTPRESMGLFYDIPTYFSDCEAYLTRFLGEDWENAPTLRAEEIRSCFLSRNGKDKRFKTDAQKEAGISLEEARITALREDYLFVRGSVERGDLPYTIYQSAGYETEEGHVGPEYTIGINLGKLAGITDLFYYMDGENKSAQELTLLLFDNDSAEGNPDLKFESFALIRYLLKTYEPAHS